MSSKKCARCKETKDLNDFFKKAMNFDGRYAYCKVCSKTVNREKYLKKRGPVKERLPKPIKPKRIPKDPNKKPPKRVPFTDIFPQEQYGHAMNLRRSFGITLDEYNQMFTKNNGCCYICNRHQTTFKRRLAVDHCHQTGKIRGLLCIDCNVSLGRLKESIEILQSMIDYIKKTV